MARVLAVGSLFLVLACGDEGDRDPCSGVDCSGFGRCTTDGRTASCECNDGFVARGLTCVQHAGDGDGDADADGQTDGGRDSDIDEQSDSEGPECEDNSDCDDGLDCSEDICDDHGDCVFVTDHDEDGVSCDEDCDDNDEHNFPDNVELCDQSDNDCDGQQESPFGVFGAVEDVVLNEVGHTPTHPALAWSGQSYGVAYCDDDSSAISPAFVLLDQAGQVLTRASVTAPAAGCESMSIAWNGEAFVMLFGAGASTFTATFSETGEAGSVAEVAIAPPITIGDLEHIGDGNCALGWVSQSEALFTVLDGCLTPGPIHDVHEYDSVVVAKLSVATGPQRIIVALTRTQDGSSTVYVEVHVFQRTGEYVTMHTVPMTTGIRFSAQVAATDTGFVVAWGSYETISAVSLDQGGSLDDTVVSNFEPPEGAGVFRAFHMAATTPRGGMMGAGALALCRNMETGINNFYRFRINPNGQSPDPLTPAGVVSVAGPSPHLAVAAGSAGFAYLHQNQDAQLLDFTSMESCFY